MNILKNWLAHPLTRGLPLDDAAIPLLRARIVEEKGFLRRIYGEWYEWLTEQIPSGPGYVLELGSGAGFLSRFVPGLISSELILCPRVRLVANALDLPFTDGSLRAVLMTDVFHHITRPRRFLRHLSRCVRPGGVVAMVEPWVSPWSRRIYSRFHDEPFVPDAERWEFSSDGPLSGANNALPWIMFERDRAQFEMEFPEWRVERLQPMMPFRYLLAGGISLRNLMPAWTFPLWTGVEQALNPWMRWLAMFARIVLRRKE